MFARGIRYIPGASCQHPFQNTDFVFTEIELTVNCVALLNGIAASNHILITDVRRFLKLVPENIGIGYFQVIAVIVQDNQRRIVAVTRQPGTGVINSPPLFFDLDVRDACREFFSIEFKGYAQPGESFTDHVFFP